MKVTFILPSVGRVAGEPYPRGWQMEPLSMATLSALTPPELDRAFYDDRLDEIPYDEPTDLVALNAETYTAQRAYQIADRFRRRGVPVVLGGFHPTLVPDEAAGHADAILTGESEDVWPELLADRSCGTLKPRYASPRRPELGNIQPDRSIYQGKDYLGLSLVETARGCPHECEFCSIARFYQRSYTSRPIEAVVEEIRSLPDRTVFFVDDNFGADRQRAAQLLEALIPLRIRWACQMSLDVASDPVLLDLMQRSGCTMALVGFESLDEETVATMHKRVNAGGLPYGEAIRRLRRHGVSVYGTLVFGYDNDTEASFEHAYRFVLQNKLFLAAFNHLVPFPGTAVFERLAREGRLLDDRWWLSEEYRFGDVAFRPAQMSAERLAELCFLYRRKFYGLGSILRRGFDLRANCRGAFKALVYWTSNIGSRREVGRRQGLPLGVHDEVKS